MNKQYKYEFKLEVHKVYLRIPSQCNVQIWWRRGKGKTITRNPVKLKGGQSYFKIAQTLAIQGKCVLKNGIFEPKQSLIQIVIFNYDNTTKLGGSCVVDLTKIISSTNISMNHQQNFQLPLQNTPDKNAKIVFTLFVKFLGQCSQDSMADISFQANMNQTSDMTFRPTQRQRKFSQRKSTQQQFYKPPEGPISFQKHLSQQNIPLKLGQRPMQFSFNPKVDPQRQKQNKAHLQMISELRQQINDKTKQIDSLKQRIIKFQQNQRKSYSVYNQKSLNLMNELNISNNKSQQYKKDIKQLSKQLSIVEQEKKQYQRQIQDLKQQNNMLAFKFQKIQKQISNYSEQTKQLKKKVQQMNREKQQLRDQLLKQQAKFINLSNKYEKQMAATKIKGNNQLIQISQELKDIKSSHQNLRDQNLQIKNQNAQLKKVLMQRAKQLEKLNFNRLQMQDELQQLKKSISEIVKQKQRQKHTIQKKYQLLEDQFKKKQLQLRQIQEQFTHLQSNNFSTSKEKDQQIIVLRDKVNNSVHKIQQLMKKQDSNNILISELKVRIKNLQTVCSNLEKQIDEKDEMIEEKQSILEKAKIYVKQKQKQLEQRDQFIENAKNYVNERQKQFQQEKKKYEDHLKNISSNQMNSSKQVDMYKKKISELTSQNVFIQNSLREKQRILYEKQSYINNLKQNFSSRDQRIEGLQNYIQSLQQRMQITQDQLQEINRKNKGLNETLEEMVRKNFETQIQLNIKTAQLEALKTYR